MSSARQSNRYTYQEHTPTLSKLSAMAIRNPLIAALIAGSLLALPDISSCLLVSRHPPQRRAASPTTSAPAGTAILQYMAAPQGMPKSQQNEAEVITCRVILWKLFCKVRVLKNTAMEQESYNKSRGILGFLQKTEMKRKSYNKSRGNLGSQQKSEIKQKSYNKSRGNIEMLFRIT